MAIPGIAMDRSKNSARFWLPTPVLIIALLVGQVAHARDPQKPSSSGKDEKGLLRIDTAMFDVAAATGGDFYFWAPGEFATSTLEIAIKGEPLLLAYGEAKPLVTEELPIPIDSQMTRLDVFVGAQQLDMASLIRPDGTSVRDGEEHVKIQKYQHMMIYAIDAPPPGQWHLELAAEGRRAVTAHGGSQGEDGIELSNFDFVEFQGRPGHQRMMPVEGPLPGGAGLRCRLRLSGDWSTARFAFVGLSGAPIAELDLRRLSGSEFSGKCEVPMEPFRVLARGRDANGIDFQRLIATSRMSARPQ